MESSNENEKWALLETLKPFTSKPGGVLQDAQVFQLNAYPIYYFGDEKAKTAVDLEKQIVQYTVTPDKRLKKQQLNLAKEHLALTVKALLGEDWQVRLVKPKKAV